MAETPKIMTDLAATRYLEMGNRVLLKLRHCWEIYDLNYACSSYRCTKMTETPIMTGPAARYLERRHFHPHRTICLPLTVKDGESIILSKVCSHYGVAFLACSTLGQMSHVPNS
jgi:hypothetical protein